MKSFFTLTVFLLISILFVQPANGQKLLKNIQNRVQKHAEKKAEDKAVEKANKEIDEAIDKAFEPSEEEKKKGQDEGKNNVGMNIMNKLGFSSEPVPVEDNYTFNQKIQMHLVTYDKKGNKDDEGDFITHLSDDSNSMAYEVVSGNMANSEYGLFIIDATNGAMIMLSEENGEKTGLVYGMSAFFQSIGESYEEDMDLSETPDTYLANPNVKKTGKTKTIAGYKCEQYLFEDESTESEIWITKDLKMKSRDFFSTLFKISAYSSGMAWGYMMESTSLDKKRGTKTVATVTDIDTHSKVHFALTDYKISNLGNFTIPGSGEEK